MIEPTWINGSGMLTADWALALLAALSAAVQYWRIAVNTKRTPLRLIGLWCVALGWTMLALRLLWALSAGYDPKIAPLSLVAAGLLAAGTISVSASEFKCAARIRRRIFTASR